MNTELIPNSCPKCGASIPTDAPEGLCPGCVLAGAIGGTDAGRKPAAPVHLPSIESIAAAFPQLEIVEVIGFGGMGVVYKARQPQLDRWVALKVLPQTLASDPAFAERFQREARFLARLNHPNIVTVYDFGQSAGYCFLLLEYVDGVNLRQAMQAGRFSSREALAIVPKICEALQFAHEKGVLHRDIKPENILLDSQGRVKLVDFGIAKLMVEPGDRPGDVTLTQSGSRLGTAHYMAPEQVEHPSDVDHRADIYSLGVIFYELLTGELPLGRFAAPSEKSDTDARVDAIVFRALAKEREFRQQSVSEVKTQVEGLGEKQGQQIGRGAGTKSSAPPASRLNPGAARPNPWPNRLFWLFLSLVLVPASMLLAGILGPVIARNDLGIFGLFMAMLIPLGTLALVVYGFRRTAPQIDPTQPAVAWSPWPRRLFYTLLLGIGIPVLLLAVGIAIPAVLRQRGNSTERAGQSDSRNWMEWEVLDHGVTAGQEEHVTARLTTREPADLRLIWGQQRVTTPLLESKPGTFSTELRVSWQVTSNRLQFKGKIGVDDRHDWTVQSRNPHDTSVGNTSPLNTALTPVWNHRVALLWVDGQPIQWELLSRTTTNGDIGGLPQILVTNLASVQLPVELRALHAIPFIPNIEAARAAALRWHKAWKRSEEVRSEVRVGVTPSSGPEMAGALHSLYAAEDEFRGLPLDAAFDRLAYAEEMMNIVEIRFSAGTATRKELEAAETELSVAKAAFGSVAGPGGR